MKLTKEERLEKRKQKELENIYYSKLKDIQKEFIPAPTVQYNIGEVLKGGNHIIIDKFNDGAFYYINSQQNLKTSFYTGVFVSWMSIQKNRTEEENNSIPVLSMHEFRSKFNVLRIDLSSLLSRIYHFGVNMDPEYQRELVWTLEDKQKLIQSIFNDIDIGSFVFCRNSYDDDYLYEILDGKQRLSCIADFYENRFKYNDFFFNELNYRDQSWFKRYVVSISDISNVSEKQKYEYFLKLNTSAKPIKEEHIKRVQDLYNELI